MAENPERRAQADRAQRQQRALNEALRIEAAREAPRARAKTPESAQPPPAGWYRHPTMADTQRYWDGHSWTDHIAPGLPGSSAPPQYVAVVEKDQTGLIVAGLIMAILFPVGGFIAGCVLLSRKPGAGVACMLISVIAMYYWYDYFTPDAPVISDYYSDY